MKKNILTGFLILLVTGAFGQIDISVGAQAGGGINTFTYQNEISSSKYYELNQTDTLIGGGIFVDVLYVRLSISYGMSLGKTGTLTYFDHGNEYHSIPVESPAGYSWTFLNIGLLGKYPLPLGSIIIWPAAGILYSITLNTDMEFDYGYDIALNDLYLSTGCGFDITITNNLFVTGSVLYNLNLTPNPSTMKISEEFAEPSWHRIMACVGIGYKI